MPQDGKQLQMISDLDEREDESELAVEMLGLKDIKEENELRDDASFGKEDGPSAFDSNYSGNPG